MIRWNLKEWRINWVLVWEPAWISINERINPEREEWHIFFPWEDEFGMGWVQFETLPFEPRAQFTGGGAIDVSAVSTWSWRHRSNQDFSECVRASQGQNSEHHLFLSSKWEKRSERRLRVMKRGGSLEEHCKDFRDEGLVFAPHWTPPGQMHCPLTHTRTSVRWSEK